MRDSKASEFLSEPIGLAGIELLSTVALTGAGYLFKLYQSPSIVCSPRSRQELPKVNFSFDWSLLGPPFLAGLVICATHVLFGREGTQARHLSSSI